MFMKEKILVINDDAGIRSLTKLPLEQQGFDVYEADDGRKGIEASIRLLPDLILLDVMMPEMDGYETCEQLKQNPTTQEIPVIFLSSLANPKDKIKGLELGGVDFVNNVIDKGELLARVQNQLKIKSLTKALTESNQSLLLKQELLDHDLKAAAMIQKSFLPQEKSKSPRVNVSWMWCPSHPLGGDIFNMIPHDPSRLIIYMVDVSGHDVPSALVTVSVSQFLHQLNQNSKDPLSPKEIMCALNKEYPMERFDRYFTIFYAILNLDSGKLTYSRGGHLPGIKLEQNQPIEFLEAGGPLIGLSLEHSFEEGSTHLAIGDKMILYTDGITDIKNKKDEFYGIDRFCDVLNSNKEKSVDQILYQVQQSLAQFTEGEGPPDDMSLLILERKDVK